jgi:hypothetical protein
MSQNNQTNESEDLASDLLRGHGQQEQNNLS